MYECVSHVNKIVINLRLNNFLWKQKYEKKFHVLISFLFVFTCRHTVRLSKISYLPFYNLNIYQKKRKGFFLSSLTYQDIIKILMHLTNLTKYHFCPLTNYDGTSQFFSCDVMTHISLKERMCWEVRWKVSGVKDRDFRSYLWRCES